MLQADAYPMNFIFNFMNPYTYRIKKIITITSPFARFVLTAVSRMSADYGMIGVD